MKHFKRIVSTVAFLATGLNVQASPIDELFAEQAKLQGNFENLSKDLASTFTYKAASPAASLAGGIIPVGFDVAIEGSMTKLGDDSILGNYVSDIPVVGGFIPGVPFARGHVQVGVAIPFIPFIPAIDVGLQAMQFPGYFSHMGGELKINIAGGNILLPAVAVRGVFSNTGLTADDKDVASVMTYGAELAISKGFGIGIKVTPYGGVGYHMYNVSSGLTHADLIEGTGLSASQIEQYANLSGSLLEDVSGGQFKWFVGANLKVVALNFGYEMDKTGDAMTHTAKLGFVF